MISHKIFFQNYIYFETIGTAKDHVVVDYAERMQDSIQKLQDVMSHSTHYLLTSSKSYYKPILQKSSFDLDDFRETYDSLPKQSNINIESPDEPSRYIWWYIFCLHILFQLFVYTFLFTGLFCSILMLGEELKWLQSKYLFPMLECTRFITSKETMKVGKK